MYGWYVLFSITVMLVLICVVLNLVKKLKCTTYGVLNVSETEFYLTLDQKAYEKIKRSDYVRFRVNRIDFDHSQE